MSLEEMKAAAMRLPEAINKGNLSAFDELIAPDAVDHSLPPGMPASNKSASWSEIHIVRYAKGKVREHWAVIDQVSMLTQLGFMPAPGGH